MTLEPRELERAIVNVLLGAARAKSTVARKMIHEGVGFVIGHELLKAQQENQYRLLCTEISYYQDLLRQYEMEDSQYESDKALLNIE